VTDTDVAQRQEGESAAELAMIDTKHSAQQQQQQPQQLASSSSSYVMRDRSSSRDVVAAVAMSQQHGVVTGEHSRTTWSNSTHQRTLHVSYTAYVRLLQIFLHGSNKC